MMNSVNRKIMSRLAKMEENPRKALSVPFKPENIEKLDAIAKAMTKHSGNTTTRNMLIEDAVESFIEEAMAILEEERITLELENDDCFDTIVCPAKMDDNYQQAFFNEREWRFVRVAESKKEKIKYIALYVGAPQSAISHYAKVTKHGFEYDSTEKKYRIKLDGDPIQLSKPIPLGSTSPLNVRSPKYTTLQKLLTANEVKDLYGTDD